MIIPGMGILFSLEDCIPAEAINWRLHCMLIVDWLKQAVGSSRAKGNRRWYALFWVSFCWLFFFLVLLTQQAAREAINCFWQRQNSQQLVHEFIWQWGTLKTEQKWSLLINSSFVQENWWMPNNICLKSGAWIFGIRK